MVANGGTEKPLLNRVGLNKITMYLSLEEANRIITQEEFMFIRDYVEYHKAIRCNKGTVFTGGAGYNISTQRYLPNEYSNNIEYATALYASICFSQDTIHDGLHNYYLLLMSNCNTAGGEKYKYTQGSDWYYTFPKAGSLGVQSTVLHALRMDDSAINLGRKVVNLIIAEAKREYVRLG